MTKLDQVSIDVIVYIKSTFLRYLGMYWIEILKNFFLYIKKKVL